MPRQNRVTPFSTLISTPARGTLMGNRGCLHDAYGQIRRPLKGNFPGPYQGQRWIICLVEFKGRKRTVMTPGQYTELFFLDEATALAAGHRPCAECQRDRFNVFRETWAKANLEYTTSARPAETFMLRPAATDIDAVLHQERLAASPQARLCHTIADLPDGTFVTEDDHTPYLVLNNQLLQWTPTGYEPPTRLDIRFPVRVLTPASVVRTLAAGYDVGLHSTALSI